MAEAARNLIISVTDPEGVVVDVFYVTIENPHGDARDAVAAIRSTAEEAGIDDWSPDVRGS